MPCEDLARGRVRVVRGCNAEAWATGLKALSRALGPAKAELIVADRARLRARALGGLSDEDWRVDAERPIDVSRRNENLPEPRIERPDCWRWDWRCHEP